MNRSKIKWYWVIEIAKSFEIAYSERLPGGLSHREIAIVLQRLASRDLSPAEVIAASIRRPSRTALLEVRVDGPPNGKRTIIWLPALPNYKASH
jgi:hypothetical protein